MLPNPPRRNRALVWSIAVVSLPGLFAATSATAGTISGSLTLPAPAAAPARRDGPGSFYWEEWNGFLDPRPARIHAARELAVVLVGQGTGPDNAFSFSGGDLLPRTLVARAGTDVRIDNTDGCTHELYSDDIEGLSALSTAPGNARTFAAPAPGHYTLRDRLYAHVEGHLHVLPDLLARGTLDAGGRFSFPDVAPGSYTLKVFHGAREVASRPVEVTAAALTVDPIAIGGAAGE